MMDKFKTTNENFQRKRFNPLGRIQKKKHGVFKKKVKNFMKTEVNNEGITISSSFPNKFNDSSVVDVKKKQSLNVVKRLSQGGKDKSYYNAPSHSIHEEFGEKNSVVIRSPSSDPDNEQLNYSEFQSQFKDNTLKKKKLKKKSPLHRLTETSSEAIKDSCNDYTTTNSEEEKYGCESGAADTDSSNKIGKVKKLKNKLPLNILTKSSKMFLGDSSEEVNSKNYFNNKSDKYVKSTTSSEGTLYGSELDIHIKSEVTDVDDSNKTEKKKKFKEKSPLNIITKSSKRYFNDSSEEINSKLYFMNDSDNYAMSTSSKQASSVNIQSKVNKSMTEMTETDSSNCYSGEKKKKQGSFVSIFKTSSNEYVVSTSDSYKEQRSNYVRFENRLNDNSEVEMTNMYSPSSAKKMKIKEAPSNRKQKKIKEKNLRMDSSYELTSAESEPFEQGFQERKLEDVICNKDTRNKGVIYNPLVVELQSETSYMKTPALLKCSDTDNGGGDDAKDHFDEALKRFYESLKTLPDSEVSVAPEAAVEETGSCSSETELIEETSVPDEWVNVSCQSENVPPIVFEKIRNHNKFVVFMKHPISIYFRGKLSVTVLRGRIEVLGHIMDADTNPRQVIYAPMGFPRLSIDTCYWDPPTADEYELMSKKLDQLEIHLPISKRVITEVENHDCVVLFEAPLPSPLENYMNALEPKMNLFSVGHESNVFLMASDDRKLWNRFEFVEKALNCRLEMSGKKSSHHRKGQKWEGTVEMLTQSNMDEPGSCTVVCGGKGVGKSTFLRFVVNKFLPIFKGIVYIDFDPGQTEFTVPGCVSVVLVKEPLVGPNFSRVVTPECMVYVGDVNVAQCPVQYLDSAQYIIDYCKSKPELQRLPWVVNTMGFNRGIGVDLTVALIRMLNPQYVIQIQSPNRKLNFPSYLDRNYVWAYRSRFSKVPLQLDYELLRMNSAAVNMKTLKQLDTKQKTPRFLREIMILSYLSRMVQPPSFSLADLTPYTTEFSKLTLFVCHTKISPNHILSAMNGSLVALCSYNGCDVICPDDNTLPRVLRQHVVCPCLGFGVVRGIDLDQKRLFLSSPLSETELSKVTCLMLGAVTLPACVYTNPQTGIGHIPYVTAGVGHLTSTTYTRKRRPV